MSDPRVVDDPSELAALFKQDTAAHIYALADLAEPYWSRSTWWRSGDAVVGLVGLSDVDRVVYSVSTADPVGTLELLREVEVEIPSCLVTGPVGVGDLFRGAGRALRWNRRYNRFHLASMRDVPERPAHVVDLSAADARQALALYAAEPDAAFFLPEMLNDATFVGVREANAMIAIAGTHVVARQHRAAAIGAVFVHPDHRGRGLGKDVTAGVIDRLAGRIDHIGLNCTEHNVTARQIYTSMGFAEGLRYEECELAD